MPYATKQQQSLLRCLRGRADAPVTAAELAEDLRRAGEPVGLATIYRQLDRLEQAGRVHKVNTEEGAFYQYCGAGAASRDCFLLKCGGCGRILHLDCSHLRDFYRHLEREHGFLIDARGTVFTGLCAVCAARRKEAADDGGR